MSRYGTVPRLPTAPIDSFPLASFFAKAYERNTRIKDIYVYIPAQRFKYLSDRGIIYGSIPEHLLQLLLRQRRVDFVLS